MKEKKEILEFLQEFAICSGILISGYLIVLLIAYFLFVFFTQLGKERIF